MTLKNLTRIPHFILLLAFSLLSACDDDSSNTQPTTSDTSGSTSGDTSGTTSGDTSGITDDTSDTSDTSGSTSGDTSGTTSGDTSDDTDGVIIPVNYDGLVINEVAAAGEPSDWIELYNGTDATIDLSVVRLSDDRAAEGVPFPSGTSIPAGGYYFVYLESTAFPGFQLGGDEEFAIFAPDGTSIDLADWNEGQSPETASFGRIPNGTGDFKTLTIPTPGYANQDNSGGAVCGDGVTADTEDCDDLNTVNDDGCSAACLIEDGWYCDGEPSDCTTQCGDNAVAGDEACDDGNTTPGDGCDATCQWEQVTNPGLVINEVVHAPVDPGVDWIELYNTSNQTIDLTGWSITDDQPTSNFYEFATGTSIAAGEHLLFERDPGDGTGTFGFGLGAADAVMLFNSDGAVVDTADWIDGDAPEGSSYGRLPDGTGDFQTLSTPTPGAANGL